MTTNSLTYKDLTIHHVVKKGMKHSYISISADATILLKTPKVSQSFIVNLLDEKEFWLRKKLAEIKKYPTVAVDIQNEVLFLGNVYSIKSLEVKSLKLKLEKLRSHSSKNILKCYDSFYKEYAIKYIIPRVEYFSKLMSLEYSEIKFRKMKRRWGSCNSKKVLTFNTELIKVKKELIDYVVVHELAHLKHMDHSKKFHALVLEYLPNSKKYIEELKQTRISIF